MSNAERQRRFRGWNPGYYGRLHARRRAAVKASVAAMATATPPAAAEPLTLPAPVAIPVKPVQPALPAPAMIPMILNRNAIAAAPIQIASRNTNRDAA